jgi:hypothetical protein
LPPVAAAIIHPVNQRGAPPTVASGMRSIV